MILDAITKTIDKKTTIFVSDMFLLWLYLRGYAVIVVIFKEIDN